MTAGIIRSGIVVALALAGGLLGCTSDPPSVCVGTITSFGGGMMRTTRYCQYEDNREWCEIDSDGTFHDDGSSCADLGYPAYCEAEDWYRASPDDCF